MSVCVLEDARSSLQLVHIETTELPRYFAVVTQLRRQVAAVAADGGLICTPQGTKVSFPPDACWRSTKVAVKVGTASLCSVSSQNSLFLSAYSRSHSFIILIAYN